MLVDAVTQPGGARDKAQNGTLTTTSAKRELTRISSKRRSVSRYIKKRDFRGFPLQDKFVQFPHSTPVGSDHQDPSYRWYLGMFATTLASRKVRPLSASVQFEREAVNALPALTSWTSTSGSDPHHLVRSLWGVSLALWRITVSYWPVRVSWA